MPKTTLILIRHGETATNVKGILHKAGDTDSLTQKGIDQIERASVRLKEMGLSELFCSNEFRAIESARIISQVCKVSLIVLDDIEERHWGDFSGRPFSEIKKVLDPMSTADRYTFVPQGGESWKEAEDRLIARVRVVVRGNLNKTVAIVTHGGSIRILMPYLLKAPLEETFKHDPRNASFSIFDIEGDIITAVKLDDVEHLGTLG